MIDFLLGNAILHIIKVNIYIFKNLDTTREIYIYIYIILSNCQLRLLEICFAFKSMILILHILSQENYHKI